MKYKVIKSCVLFFGSLNRACIALNVGQVWEGRRLSIDSDFYTVSRNNITMEIHKEDLNKYFDMAEKRIKESDNECINEL